MYVGGNSDTWIIDPTRSWIRDSCFRKTMDLYPKLIHNKRCYGSKLPRWNSTDLGPSKFHKKWSVVWVLPMNIEKCLKKSHRFWLLCSILSTDFRQSTEWSFRTWQLESLRLTPVTIEASLGKYSLCPVYGWMLSLIIGQCSTRVEITGYVAKSLRINEQLCVWLIGLRSNLCTHCVHRIRWPVGRRTIRISISMFDR